jgi:hypothetical protein
LYEVETAKSTPENPIYRKANLRDARKVGACPSVTAICGILDKPVLTSWKIQNAIEACIQFPQEDGEPQEASIERIDDIARSLSGDAAQLGSSVHDAIENYVMHGTIIQGGTGNSFDERVEPIMAHVRPWLDANVKELIGAELSFCRDGYGGKLDILYINAESRVCLDDFKTQQTKEGEKVRSYPEHGMQLAACHHGSQSPEETLTRNIIISTTEPGRIEVIDHTEDRAKDLEAFFHCLDLFCFLRNYDPRTL